MLLRKKLNEKSGRWLTAIGMLSISSGITLGRITSAHTRFSDFTEGFLLGLGELMLMGSIALNARSLARIRSKRSE